MAKLILILTLGFLSSSYVNAQTSSNWMNDTRILDIRTSYKEILSLLDSNALTSYTRNAKNFGVYQVNKSIYLDERGIIRILIISSGDEGGSHEKKLYYNQAGKLIFCFIESVEDTYFKEGDEHEYVQSNIRLYFNKDMDDAVAFWQVYEENGKQNADKDLGLLNRLTYDLPNQPYQSFIE